MALNDFTAYLTWFKKATDAAKTAPAIERLLVEYGPRIADMRDVLAAKSEVQRLCDRIVKAKDERELFAVLGDMSTYLTRIKEAMNPGFQQYGVAGTVRPLSFAKISSARKMA